MPENKDLTPLKTEDDGRPAGYLEERGEQSIYERIASDQTSTAEKVGMMKGHRQLAGIGQQASILICAQIRKSKAYKGYFHKDDIGNSLKIERWEDFCREVLGRPRSEVDTDIRNLDVLGQQVFNLFAGVGIAKSLTTTFRRLPELERDPIISEIIEHKDDHALIEDLIRATLDKHQIENNKLKAERDEAREDAAAKDRVIEDEKALVTELQIAEERRKNLSMDDALKEARTQISHSCLGAMSGVEGLRQAIRGLRKISNGQPHLTTLCNTRIYEVYELLDDLVVEFGIPAYQSMLLDAVLARADSVGRAVDEVAGTSNRTENSPVTPSNNITHLHAKSNDNNMDKSCD